MPTLVFLIDVDNTLIDNDFVKSDLDEHIKVEMGETVTNRFWELYEQAREESGVVNIPLALKWLREETPLSELDEQTYLHVHSLFDNYPFFNALYPHTLETLHYLRTLGLTVIVSDGDLYFQAEKIFNSAIAETVEDDKPQILTESKLILGDQLTTAFVQQGKYAEGLKPDNFAPELTVQHIGDIRRYSAEQFLHV